MELIHSFNQEASDCDAVSNIRLTNGCSVKLLGELVESRGAKQDKEFRVETAEVVGECDPEV